LLVLLVLPTMLLMRRAARIRCGDRRVAPAASVVAVLVAFVLSATPVVAAAPGSDRGDQLQEAIGEASAQEAAALTQLAEIQERRSALDSALQQLDGQIASVQAKVTALQQEEDRLHLEANRIDAEARATDAELREMKGQAVRAAAAMYRGESQEGAYAELLDASSLQEAYAGGMYLRHLSDRRRAVVDQLDALAKQLAGQRREAEKKRVAAQAAREAAVAEASKLDTLRSEQARQRDLVAVQESAEQALVASIQARKAEYEAELAALQASSSDIGSMLYERQRIQTRGTFSMSVRPVDAPITSSFGSRLHPILGIWRMHAGIDMGSAWGDPVMAVADGVVVTAGTVAGYGQCVIIDHGNQYATLYAHGSAVYASAGERVEAGDTVMASGSSGLSTGPHLHYEVRLLGTPIDPVQFF
jgi:murein DD-endopeptidase MepM/ murein hydrolase activator NlpD